MSDVSDSNSDRDPWAFAAMLVWIPFFLVGLFPEDIYYELRAAGYVVTQRALVNSPLFVTFACAAYMTVFAYRRSLEGGASGVLAQVIAIQVLILSMVAFLPYPFHLLLTPGSFNIPAMGADRFIAPVAVFGLPALKLTSWCYLLVFVVQYYCWGHRRAFAEMTIFLPGSPRRVSKAERSADAQADAANKDAGAGDATGRS